MANVVEEMAVAFTTEGESEIEAVLHDLTTAVEHLGETLHHVQPHSEQATAGLKSVAAGANAIGDQLDKVIPKHKKHAQSVEGAAIAAAHGRKIVGEGIEEMGVFTEQIAKRMEHVGVTMAFTFASMANGGEAGLARLLHMGASLAFMFGTLPGIFATVGLALGEGMWHHFHKEAEKAQKEEEALVKSADDWFKKLNQGAGGEFFKQSDAIQKELEKLRVKFDNLTKYSTNSWEGIWAQIKAAAEGDVAMLTKGPQEAFEKLAQGGSLTDFFTQLVKTGVQAAHSALEKGVEEVGDKVNEAQRTMVATFEEGLRSDAEERIALISAAISDFGTLLSTKTKVPMATEELQTLLRDQKAVLAGLKDSYHVLDEERSRADEKVTETNAKVKMLLDSAAYHPIVSGSAEETQLKAATKEAEEARTDALRLDRKQAFYLREQAAAAANVKKLNDILFQPGEFNFTRDLKLTQEREAQRSQLFQEGVSQRKVMSVDEFETRRQEMTRAHMEESRLLTGRLQEAATLYGTRSNEYKTLLDQQLQRDRQYDQQLRALMTSQTQWIIAQIQLRAQTDTNAVQERHLKRVDESAETLRIAKVELEAIRMLKGTRDPEYQAALAKELAAERQFTSAKIANWEFEYTTRATQISRLQGIGRIGAPEADRRRMELAKDMSPFIDELKKLGATEEQIQAVMNRVTTDADIAFRKAATLMAKNAQTLGQSIVSGITMGMESAFSGGGLGNGFRKMLGALLSGLGDIAIRFGTESAAFLELMDAIMKAITFFNPEMGLVAAFGMIALGAALKAAGSAMSGHGSGSGGGGGGTGGGTTNATGGSYSSGLPQIGMISPVSGASRSIGNAGSLAQMQPVIVNATIIGKDDPSAQRALLEMISRAQRRGTTSG